MTNWTNSGHLSELALELWVANEAEAHDLPAIESHLASCPACRAKAAEWRGLLPNEWRLRGCSCGWPIERRA
jgi:hypothetical protein